MSATKTLAQFIVDTRYDTLPTAVADAAKGEAGYVEHIVTAGKLSSMALAGFWINPSWLWTELLPNGLSCLREILTQSGFGA